jgi:hypothetical protein
VSMVVSLFLPHQTHPTNYYSYILVSTASTLAQCWTPVQPFPLFHHHTSPHCLMSLFNPSQTLPCRQPTRPHSMCWVSSPSMLPLTTYPPLSTHTLLGTFVPISYSAVIGSLPTASPCATIPALSHSAHLTLRHVFALTVPHR